MSDEYHDRRRRMQAVRDRIKAGDPPNVYVDPSGAVCLLDEISGIYITDNDRVELVLVGIPLSRALAKKIPPAHIEACQERLKIARDTRQKEYNREHGLRDW